jgi:hypothetical protein
MLKKIFMSISALASMSLFVQACNASDEPSAMSNITSAGKTLNYVSGKNFPVSQSIQRALLSAHASASLTVNEVYGSSGEIEGIVISGSVWMYDSTGYYTAVGNVTRIYPDKSVVFAYVEGNYQAVGSYSSNDDGTIKQVEELCTGSYKNSCNLDYNPSTKIFTFKNVN